MRKELFSRRDFVKTTAVTSLGLTLSGTSFALNPNVGKKTVKVAVVGTGNRGTGLMKNLLAMEGVEIPALCDINKEKLDNACKICIDAGKKEPDRYFKDEYSFQQLMDRDDLDAVIIATYWEWHAPMALYAMKRGIYPGVEVPIALSLDECWNLVNTSEKTGVPCMMLENWSFRRDNLAILNMIRQGLFGEIVHCHCAHSHDCIDHWFFDSEDGHQRWGAKYLLNYNRDQYPTHALGPVLSWMDVNCGDTITEIYSAATASRGINAYFKRKFGEDHPNANLKYKQGDIVTSTLKTKKGKTIIVNYDMQLPRPYDNRWTIQGTLGIYNEQRNAIYLTGTSPQYHQWEPFKPYEEKHLHKWWKEGVNTEGGHGGVDGLELTLFVEAVRNGTQTPIDVYDSVTMSAVVALSGISIEKNKLVEFPDFTRGKWETRKPYFAV
ncbi:MAG: Gfo/Idh/MocA family oxidoreductase [Bacteroidales bacterium]|nr:Gfo/Idh/MocA family oxidoreductase [Bacteroidales bacterium]